MAKIIAHTAIFNHLGRLLILRRSEQEKVLPGLWDLPGGSARRREDPEAAAIRETKEESGLSVAALRPLSIFSQWDENKQEQFITIVFRTDQVMGEIILNNRDHDDYRWVMPVELASLPTVPYLRDLKNYIL